MDLRARIVALNAVGKRSSGNVDIDQLMDYIKTGERNNGKLTVLLDDARKRVCADEKGRGIFMKELYQGLYATLNNMTEEQVRKYSDETYENMRKETRREIKHEVEKEYQKEYQKKEKEYQKKMDETLLNEKKKAALRLYSKGMNEKEIAEIVDADPQQVDEWFVSENVTQYGEKKTEA